MNGTVLPVPVAVPLLAAALLIATPRRRRLHLVTGLGVNAGVLVLGGMLLAATMNGTVLTQRVGGWPPGFAITLAADAFSALMLTVSALLVLASLAYPAVAGEGGPLFMPLVLILSAGVYGAYLTADLFNLFVFIEVMLAPSYALLTMTGGRRVAAGRIYVTVSLLASTIFLAGVALVYSVTGTVNLGELAGAAQHGTAAALACAVVLLALAAKAAVVPLHGWLPRTYPAASPAVMLLFSGLLTKVGVYAIIRIYSVVFAGAPQYRWVLMAAALLTISAGVLAAVGEQAVRDILAFDMVSQIGYILLGLALFSTAGLSAAIFYLVQYVLVQAALLVCAGAIETRYGTGRLGRVTGLSHRDPLLATTFLIAAFSLAGLPPLSGFIAKLALIRAAITGASYLAAAIAIAVSFLTLLAMLKIWTGAFAGRETAATARPAGRHAEAAMRPALIAPGAVLAAASIVLGIWAQPLFTAATASATGLRDTAAYVRAVTR
ncbi:MAG: monovalent cation/H+ antiporter subunit D family protein [Gemmatimonadota bacterium]